jgi:iron-sulfur cluster repair protein YtfE (RIC family)
MLRDKNLIPLSRQHHSALALCVRLDRAIRAGEVDVEAWQAEIQQQFESEIALHFTAEEEILFPAAANFTNLQALIRELLAEHNMLRDYFARAAAGELDPQTLGNFGEKLAEHIRKEERQLFEGMQRVMSAQALSALGAALDEALKDVSQACALPSEATRLRPRTISHS